MAPLDRNALTNLPDYSAFQQLARALWRDGAVRGASVLVGAGLSKNASLPGDDTPPPRLWYELLDVMAERLYGPSSIPAVLNPLRLAEEYRIHLGQAGLDDFIRSQFPDRSWMPGPLHTQLLELPWTDVLTTNWDTLLERASESTVRYSYEVVRTHADLTYACSPRIVKLHGTIGDATPLIFAEEDYRTYPIKHAAFVNLARQIFIENELCLVGFSGDDPNFLQWTGWVRDHLESSARRIYLVGNLISVEKRAEKRFWPSVVEEIWDSVPDRSNDDFRWKGRIVQLIESAKKGQPSRQEAVLRLSYLFLRGVLEPHEVNGFQEALWSDTDNDPNTLPANANTNLSYFLELPSPENVDVRKRLVARLFEPNLHLIMTPDLVNDSRQVLTTIRHLTSIRATSRVDLRPTATQASKMFDEIAAWRNLVGSSPDPFSTSMVRQYNEYVSNAAAGVLNDVVVPAMSPEDKTEPRARSLIDYILDNGEWLALGGLPLFLSTCAFLEHEFIAIVRGGLVSADHGAPAAAALAIRNWATLARRSSLVNMPQALTDQLLATIETRQIAGLPSLLMTARELLQNDFMQDAQKKRLLIALSNLRREYQYGSIEFDSAKAVTASLVRSESVKLALVLQREFTDDGSLAQWCDEAKTDALPEVRFALEEFDHSPER